VRPTIPSCVEVDAHIPRGVGRVLADESRLHQVVLNLVSNAMQAVEEKGSVRITVEETQEDWHGATAAMTRELKPGRYATLTVSDDGQGMAAETLARMYDPFFTTKELGHGTGLGLSVVHGVVSNLDGAITVESEVGRGTTFRIHLPVHTVSDVAAEPAPAAVTPAPDRIHLLLVDDERMVAEVLTRGLRKSGFEITTALDSRAALTAFLADPWAFQGLVTDQTMPGLTGMELATEVHKVRPDLPVIMLTGYSESVTPEHIAAAGIAEVLYKPVSRTDLVAAIRTHVDAAPGSGTRP
jgi:CheY-like chemotaxis protein